MITKSLIEAGQILIKFCSDSLGTSSRLNSLSVPPPCYNFAKINGRSQQGKGVQEAVAKKKAKCDSLPPCAACDVNLSEMTHAAPTDCMTLSRKANTKGSLIIFIAL